MCYISNITVQRYIKQKKIPQASYFQGLRYFEIKAPTRFELVIEVLQTFALPLGYGAIYFLSNILYSNNKKIITKYLFSVNIFYLVESKFLFIRSQN